MTLPPSLVKICSLREVEHAEYAVAAGADAIGLIFAEARRRVTIERAAAIVRELRRLQGDRHVLAIGVFVDQAASDVDRVADQVGLDLVQLHGSETPEQVETIERPVIKATRQTPGQRVDDLLASIQGFEMLSRPPVAYLLDGYSAIAAGGTGERADWETAERLGRSTGLILAGGLTPENVGAAIGRARPMGVDVGSGVETDGVKDRAKIVAFVAAARAAFATGS